MAALGYWTQRRHLQKEGNQTDISQASTLLLTDACWDIPSSCPQELNSPAQGGPCHSRPTYQHRSWNSQRLLTLSVLPLLVRLQPKAVHALRGFLLPLPQPLLHFVNRKTPRSLSFKSALRCGCSLGMSESTVSKEEDNPLCVCVCTSPL